MKLSPKEYLILKRLGKDNADIAYEFGTTVCTVQNQVQSIFKKLDVQNRTQAVLKAIQMKLLDPYQFIV